MTKAELVKYVAQQAVITHAAAEMAVNAVVEATVQGLVSEGRVNLAGLGVFSRVLRGPRKMVSLQTGKPIDVPAKNVVKFRPSVALKEAVNQ